MYRLDYIKGALSNLVGWEQDYDPSKAIDESLTQSESGVYFQGAHPLLTLSNLRAVIPDDWVKRYPLFVSGETYSEGNKVRLADGTVWVAEYDSPAGEPGGEGWAAYDPLSDYLRKLTDDGIAKTIQTFISRKMNALETRNILERRTLFNGAGRFADVIQGTGRVVGFEITPLRAEGITIRLERIGLQMRGGSGKVTVYLFHSSRREPVRQWTLDFSDANGSFRWLSFGRAFQSAQPGGASTTYDIADGNAEYLSDEHNAGGSWYLVYSQSELPKWMDAINFSRDWSREPCATCNRGDPQEWRLMTQFMNVAPFMVTAPDFDSDHLLWDPADMVYMPTTNFGINFQYTIGCDVSDFIVQQRLSFADVLQKQVAYTALKTMYLNPEVRVNRRQLNVGENALLTELDGEPGKRPTGLGYELERAYKAVEIDTKGIDRACLTCHNGGVRYGAV